MIREWGNALIVEVREAFRGEALDVAVWSAIAASLGFLMFSIAIAQAAVLLAGALWLLRLIRTRGASFKRTPLMLLYTLFVLGRLLAIFLSVDPGVSADAFRTEIFFHILFYVVAQEFDPRREDRLRFIVHLLALAGLVAACIGFIKLGLGIDQRLTSTTAGYYTLGMYLAAVLAMVFALGRAPEFFPNRTIWLLTCLMLLLGLLFTFNRLHWVAAALALLVIGFVRERRILFVLIAAGVVAVLAVPPLQHRLMQLLMIGTSMSDRDVIWRGAWMLIGEHPVFGFGLRTFPVVFPSFELLVDKGVGSWHNDYLQVYMDSGLVALIPFVAVLAAAFVLSWRSSRAWPRESLQRKLNSAIAMALVVFAVAGGMLDSLTSILYHTLLALTAVLYAARPNPPGIGTGAAGRTAEGRAVEE